MAMNGRRCLAVAGLCALCAVLMPSCSAGAQSGVGVNAPPAVFTGQIAGIGGTVCMEVADGATDNAANVQVHACFNDDKNQWIYDNGQIKSKKSGKCLDAVKKAGTADTHNVQIYACSGQGNQQWTMDASVAYTKIKSQYNQKCLSIVDNKDAVGANVHIEPCVEDGMGALLQKWYPKPAASEAAAKPAAATPAAAKPAAATPAAAKPAAAKPAAAKPVAAAPPKKDDSQGAAKAAAAAKAALPTKTLMSKNGCRCKQSWEMNGQRYKYPNNCQDPGDLHAFSWCYTEQDDYCKGVDGHHHWDRCDVIKSSAPERAAKPTIMTVNSCRCRESWEVNGQVFKYPNNCANPDHVKDFNWCFTERSDCKGVDGFSHWDRCVPISGAGVAKDLPSSTLRGAVDSNVQSTAAAAVPATTPPPVDPNGIAAAPVIAAAVADNAKKVTSNVAAPTVAAPAVPVASRTVEHVVDEKCGHGKRVGSKCKCVLGYTGSRCDTCAQGYFGFPNCRARMECNCVNGECDYTSGKCICPVRFTGARCDVCASEMFSGKDCQPGSTSFIQLANGKGTTHTFFWVLVLGGGGYCLYTGAKKYQQRREQAQRMF